MIELLIKVGYSIIILNVIKIQRFIRKHRYGPRKNFVILVLNRQLSGKKMMENEIKLRTPTLLPSWVWLEDAEIILQ